ncbi:MAG TPA: hypothetical protein VLE95_04965 [Chlamydiales bacterium]|nr:hypothetical protein [Chlamydiales bacterium]
MSNFLTPEASAVTLRNRHQIPENRYNEITTALNSLPRNLITELGMVCIGWKPLTDLSEEAKNILNQLKLIEHDENASAIMPIDVQEIVRNTVREATQTITRKFRPSHHSGTQRASVDVELHQPSIESGIHQCRLS